MKKIRDVLPNLTGLVFLILSVCLAESRSTLHWGDFLASAPLWSSTLQIGLLYGFLLGLAGFWMMVEGSVYSGLALSSTSMTGLLLVAFLFEFLSPAHLPGWAGDLSGMVVGVSLYLFLMRSLRDSFPKESITAMLYVASMGAAIFLSNFVSQGHHELENRLFGNSVTVIDSDYWISLILGIFLLCLGLFSIRKWLALVFDEIFFTLTNSSYRLFEIALRLFTAITLVIGAKNFGILSVFAMLLFPPLSGWKSLRSGFWASIFSSVSGLFVFAGGFLFSFFLDLPTGACICLAGLILFVASQTVRKGMGMRG